MSEVVVGAPLVFLVAGAGHFGTRALRLLTHRKGPHKIGVVDLRSQCVASWEALGVKGFVGDAIDVLEELIEGGGLRWVVPAVPFHLAFSWILKRASRERAARRIPLPEDLPVPNPILGKNGDIYTSYATFRCPENCVEPSGGCAVTGLPRSAPLYELLRGLKVPGLRILGVRSRQLGPGIGGILVRDLLGLSFQVSRERGPWAIFTACRCHGVISGLEIQG